MIRFRSWLRDAPPPLAALRDGRTVVVGEGGIEEALRQLKRQVLKSHQIQDLKDHTWAATRGQKVRRKHRRALKRLATRPRAIGDLDD